jgi:hypothetical protein
MEGKPGNFNHKGHEGTQRDSGIAKIASIAKIAEIEKANATCEPWGGRVEVSQRCLCYTPLKQLVSEELPEPAIKTDESLGSFDYAPLSFQQIRVWRRFAQDDRWETLCSQSFVFLHVDPWCPLWLFWVIPVFQFRRFWQCWQFLAIPFVVISFSFWRSMRLPAAPR